MRAWRTLLVPALALALAVVAAFADRALVGQAEATRAAAMAGADEDARLTAEAVRAALVPVEQAVTGGHPPSGTSLESLAVPPARAVAPRGIASYARRSRAELAELLSSMRATPNGLPEAVVARLALGPAAPVSGTAVSSVEERLLTGELPVRPEDLPFLAERLGVGSDPRVARLAARLRRAPEPDGLPAAPTFRRRLADAAHVEGWTRHGERLLRYVVPVHDLLQRAGGADRTSVLPGHATSAAPRGALSRTVAVPDVDGLLLRVTPRLPGTFRLAAMRVALWLSALTGAVGVVVLNRALAREQRALARERAFLSGVTHELRTPLTTMRVLGETLAEGRGEPREYGALVAGESQRLEGLVERVLTLTRLEHRPRFGVADPGELLCSAAAVVKPRADRRGTAIDCRLDSPLPQCHWDADAVRRALVNLLDNAVVHGRERGTVLASGCLAGGDVRLSVTDDGPGIRRTEKRKIFGRFERGTTDAPGTGLGLYLVEEVARAHNGRVDLVTAEGRGSTFTLVLPVRPEATDSEAPA